MTILITLLHIFVCFVLIGVILLQAGRGQGLTGASFGGGNVQSLFGTKGSVFLQKATSVCAILFMVTCISLDVVEAKRSRSLLQTGRPSAPMDVDQIQKALEKIKSQAAEEAAMSNVDAVDQAADALVNEEQASAAQALAEPAGDAPQTAEAPAAESSQAAVPES